MTPNAGCEIPQQCFPKQKCIEKMAMPQNAKLQLNLAPKTTFKSGENGHIDMGFIYFILPKEFSKREGIDHWCEFVHALNSSSKMPSNKTSVHSGKPSCG